MLEWHEVAHLLPHGPEWTLIDRVIHWDANRQIVTRKCITATDWMVRTHFDRGPRIVPGVMLIEFVAQSAQLLSRLSAGARNGTRARPMGNGGSVPSGAQPLLARCRAQFLRPVLAGDVLEAVVEIEGAARGITFYRGAVRSNGDEVCRVEIVGAVAPVGEAAPPVRG